MSARAAWRLETLGFSQVFRYTPGKADWFASGFPREGTQASTPRAGDVLRRDVPTCRLSDRLGEVRQRVQAAGWELCIVVNETNIVLGRLRKAALAGNPDTLVEAVMEAGPTTIRPDQPLEDLIQHLRERDVGSILVTTPDGELLGVLFRADAEAHLGGRASAKPSA